ncbi:MAG TPA: hypothetical protein VM166_12280 [Gemmatimonadaceae bacterium]|nr:hypothetical protein [Gemmatimonadaceae bacterium]
MLHFKRAPLGLILSAAISCAPIARPVSRDLAATLTRGGGITGMSETVLLSSAAGRGEGSWQRSDRPQPSRIRLSNDEIFKTLRSLDSTAVALPPSPPPDDRHCADYILMRLEVRSGSAVHVAQEECPHRTDALETYWRRLHQTFDELVRAAQ